MIILLGFLRLPTASELSCDPDVAGIIYTGQGLTSGYLPYVDSVESKPPGAYFIAAAARLIFGQGFCPFYLLGFFWHALTLLVLLLLARTLIDRRFALLAGLLYICYCSGSYIDGLCPNYETWTLLPMTIAALFVLRFMKGKKPIDSFTAGIAASFAIQIKFQAVFFAALILVILLLEIRRDKKTGVVGAGAYFFGGLIATLPLILFFAGQGALAGLAEAFFPAQPAQYAVENRLTLIASHLPAKLGGFALYALLPLVLSIIGSVFLLRRDWNLRKNPHPPVGLFLAGWLASCIFGILFLKGLFSAALFADHYWMLVLPPLSICAAVGASFVADRWKFSLPFIAAILLIQCSVPLIRAGQAAVELAKTGETASAFNRVNYHTLADRYAAQPTAEYIRNHTNFDDLIYVWDYSPSIYVHADRRAPGRHYKYWEIATSDPWGHFFDENNPTVVHARAELMSDLKRKPPKFIVAFRHKENKQLEGELMHVEYFEQLEKFLETNYQQVEDFLMPIGPGIKHRAEETTWNPITLYRFNEGEEGEK